MTDPAVQSAVFSNLAKASEKQQRYRSAELFTQLAERFDGGDATAGTLQSIRDELVRDLETEYPAVDEAGAEWGERGSLRAATWGRKVTTAQRALVDRYLAKGEALLEGKNLFVCEACGFIFLGDDPPAICPTCKAPASRFSTVK